MYHSLPRLHNNLPDETQLPNGQKFELLSLALLGVPSMAEKFMEVSKKTETFSIIENLHPKTFLSFAKLNISYLFNPVI
jgi:hypothetical protein